MRSTPARSHSLFSLSLTLGLFAIVSCGDDMANPVSSGGQAGESHKEQTSGGRDGQEPRDESDSAGGSAGDESGEPADDRPGMPFEPHCEAYFPEPPGQAGALSDGCGCLSVDDSWSCSKDTCPDEDGLVRTIAPEAGLLEVPARDFVQEGRAGRSPVHRVFYSFHPAERSPDKRPLLVFLNGGPGSATMPYLFAQTGPKTPLQEGVSDNPASYARDFNLLYIDAPFTGFSYSPSTSTSPADHLEDREAGIVLEVVLGFLARHPLLERAQVAFVGESYGGTRALLMAERLLSYPELADPEVKANKFAGTSSVYFDLGLYEVIKKHFARTRPELQGAELTPEQVAEQFGWQILIQPGLPDGFGTSFPAPPCVGSLCDNLALGPCTTDNWHDCSLPLDVDEKYDALVVPKLEDHETLSSALSVDARSIGWLRSCKPEEGSIAEKLYFLPHVPLSYLGERSGEGPLWQRGRMFYTFARVAEHQKILMTNARQDRRVRTPHFWAALHAALSNSPPGVRILSDSPEEAPRPGEVEFTFRGETTRVRYPTYLAGHMVPLRAGAELYEDILEWWSD